MYHNVQFMCNSLTFGIILTLSPNGAYQWGQKGRAEHMQRIVLALQSLMDRPIQLAPLSTISHKGHTCYLKVHLLSDNPASNPANIVHSWEEELVEKSQLNKKWATLIDAPTTGWCKKFPACLNFPPFCSPLPLVSWCTAHQHWWNIPSHPRQT